VVLNTMLAGVAVCIGLLSISFSASADAATNGATGKRVCDPSKVHTGPRGGQYRYTKNCKKVYIKKGR